MTPARFTSLFAVALSLSAAAHADPFSFTYTFGGGPSPISQGAGVTASGTFDGTLNGDLIDNITNVSLTIDGTSEGTIFAEGITASGYTDGVAIMSVDGTQNDFLFINSDYAVNSSSALYTGFLLSVTGNYASAYDGNTAIIGELNQGAISEDAGTLGLNNALNSSWTVTDLGAPSAAPDGGLTVAMLGGALIGLAALRRRFALSR